MPGSSAIQSARTDVPNLILRGDLVNLTPTPLVAAAGSTTTPQGGQFTFAPQPGGNDVTMWFSAEGAGAIPTTVTASLLTSDNGGVSWQTLVSGLALVAATVGAPQKVVNLTPGRLYAISVQTLTLGSATSVSIYATMA